MGRGGDGGDATAVAADGADAGTEAAQAGGTATATAGGGGNTPLAQLRAQGDVEGTQFLTMTGGDAGHGGVATASAGDGGSGNEQHPDGAKGGDLSAVAGDGGIAGAMNLQGMPVGTGGDGGSAVFKKGAGGTGWDGCSVSPEQPGGAGGQGGAGSGQSGLRGVGKSNGATGDVTVDAGTGDGGDGEDPGMGGDPGADNIADPALFGGTRTDGGPNFQAGQDGEHCEKFKLDASGLPDSFTHQVGVTSCPQTIGTVVITNTSNEAVEWVVTTTAPLGIAGYGTSWSGSLDPGESVTFTVIFDCSQTTSFTEDVVFKVTTSGGTTTETYSISGTVNP